MLVFCIREWADYITFHPNISYLYQSAPSYEEETLPYSERILTWFFASKELAHLPKQYHKKLILLPHTSIILIGT